MTDAETRAELERISAFYAEMWRQVAKRLLKPNPDPLDIFISKTLRLLAESQQALREIGKKLDYAYSIRGSRYSKDWEIIVDVIKIAKNACKEK